MYKRNDKQYMVDFQINIQILILNFKLVSQGIDIYTLVQPCCTSRLLWRRGRVSDCHPGDPGSIPVRVRSEDIFLHLSHLAPNVKSSYSPVQ